MIPRILHQTWKTADVPERFRDAQRSWREAHPSWEYRFWTDEDLDDLVRTRAPEILPLFRTYPEAIQRVDAARYVMLREFGGMYADLDLHCLRPVDDLLSARVVLPRTTPVGLSNQFMLAEKDHPLFHHAVASLGRAFRKWQRPWIPRHFRVLASTGPIFITGRVREMARLDGLRVLTLDEHGHGDPALSYVRHLRGNTWAGWDTHLLNFFHDHWKWLAAGGALAAGMAFFS